MWLMFFFHALYKIALVFRLPPAGEYDTDWIYGNIQDGMEL